MQGLASVLVIAVGMRFDRFNRKMMQYEEDTNWKKKAGIAFAHLRTRLWTAVSRPLTLFT